MAFIVGCGRSGTTILARVFRDHPEVCLLHEPWHLWAAVDPRCDITNLYRTIDAAFVMGSECATPEAQARFARLIGTVRRRRACARLVIEKTPHDVARIGFLEGLAAEPRYIHIVRSGVDVARSIERIAARSSFPTFARPPRNRWWGIGGSKWKALARDGAAHGYFPNEVLLLTGDAQKGAYEWLVSLGEADRWRAALGPRLYEFTYPSFTSQPMQALEQICTFLGISCPDAWLAHAVERVHPENRHEGPPLQLPPAMCERFNAYQERYGFAGTAVPASAAKPPAQPGAMPGAAGGERGEDA